MKKPLGLFLVVIILATTLYAPFASASTPATIKYAYGIEVELPAVAVTTNGQGVVSTLDIKVLYPGEGGVYFSAEPLTMLDSQASARIAVLVASALTGKNYRDYDFMIGLRSPSLIIGGPSAGAVMTVGVIAALLNKTVNDKVAMTGMINPDGTIGPVGGIPEKLKAAAEAGYKIFLIPVGQQIVYDEKIVREKTPLGYITRIETNKVNLTRLGEKLGVKVIEVATIAQAAKYFLGLNLTGKPSAVFNATYNNEQKEFFTKWFKVMLKNVTAKMQMIESYNLSSLSENDRKTIQLYLKEVNSKINESQHFFKQGKYYTSLSSLFQCLVMTENLYIQFYINGNKTRINNYIYMVNNTIENAKTILSKIKPKTLSSLEAYITASDRLSQSEKELQKAISSIITIQNLLTGEKRTVVQDTESLALARWRAVTAIQWSEYSLIPSPTIDENKLKRYSDYLLYDSETVLSYFSSLGGDKTADYDNMLELYEDARVNYDQGNYAKVISDSISLIAMATTGIHELYNTELAKTTKAVIQNAVSTFERTRYRSAIALGYLEMAKIYLENYLEDKQKSEALAALKLAILSSLYAQLSRNLEKTRSSENTSTISVTEKTITTQPKNEKESSTQNTTETSLPNTTQNNIEKKKINDYIIYSAVTATIIIIAVSLGLVLKKEQV